MSDQARPERVTQKRVIALFSDAQRADYLGYRYLGSWHKRVHNSNIEPELLQANLAQRGYGTQAIKIALQKLQEAATVGNDTPYQASMRAYRLLRYGVQAKLVEGQDYQTIHLIDWANPANNDFALAEEVTLRAGYERRPDLVLYLNGIAVAVIELKRSSVEVADGVRQLISNQQENFNRDFFSTVQLVLAGNDAQGLRYGTTGTREQFFVEWKDKDVSTVPTSGSLLDRPLAQMCAPARLLDLMHDFVLYDAGIKKVPRVHQFFGMKAAQERLKKQEGGVIWHTQGSGKSILMVLLAKWLLEHDPHARILIVTDRDELDKQIEGVLRNAGVIGESSASPRVTTRKEFVEKLAAGTPRVLCALLHKFTPDLKAPAPQTSGQFYVFVDECHRTQGGDMNKQMKRWLPHAIFIGFTGTPLLRRDKQTTHEVFGSYIHTYKFDEAVADKVVLDLKYQARDVPQQLGSRRAIDEWFDKATRGLNNYKRAMLRKRWATLEELMSSGERKQRIIADIIHDFGVLPRLDNDRGTAILVAASIYDACHYFRLFQNHAFGKQCGIITSFEPNPATISREPENSDEHYKFETYKDFVLKEGQSTKAYEDGVKHRFIHEPANMKLLIVVSKLLTGFDAPSCTYIYLDNKLYDHNLFQAICRTNRLDGDDKEYGHIVDYKEMFHHVQESIAVYTSDELEIVDGCPDDGNVKVKDWLVEGRRQLDATREALHYLCEPVALPRELEQFVRYFCGDSSNPEALELTDPLRMAFYKAVASFLRAFAALSSHLPEAGYTPDEIAEIEREAVYYADMRAVIKTVSGEEFDIKPYEADMRHLINNYIKADPAEGLGNLDSLTLTELIIATGIHDAIARKLNKKGNLSQHAIAEGIINNVRKTIIRDQLTDPRFYDRMSKLLEDLIVLKRLGTISYEEFLQRAEALAKDMANRADVDIPACLLGKAEAITLFGNLDSIAVAEPGFVCPAESDAKAALALALDAAIREKAPADWRGDEVREKQVLNALFPLMGRDRVATAAIFEIIKQQAGY